MLNRRTLLIIAGLVLLSVALWAVVVALRPLPSRSFTMATGPEGSAYAAFGERYRAALAAHGIELRLVPTGGSYDNLVRLSDPDSGISAAFVQAGTTSTAQSPDLLSLGTMFYEPLWVFCRCPADTRDVMFPGRIGTHVSIGPEGSATRALALLLMKLNNTDLARFRFEAFSPERAAEALVGGQIDAVVIDTAWESPAVQRLLADPSLDLVSFPRADAYVAMLPYLSKVQLPMGVANLALNRPPQDVTLVAPKAQLVVRSDLHPALQYLLIDAAERIHGGPGVFNGAGAFPAPEQVDLPLSREAQHMYRNGPNFLRRHLPFWLAELVQRLLLLAIPLIGIVYPLTSLAPKVWRWQIDRRVHSVYRDLLRLEKEMRTTPVGPRRDELHAELDGLEARVARARLPDSFAAAVYELKQNIRFIQERYGK
jgi:TRAP-type uncharacterized transport system substrate-binding protein